MTDADLDDAIETARAIDDDCSGSLGSTGAANLGNVEAMAAEIRGLRAVAAKVMEVEARCHRSGVPSLRDWADLAALAVAALRGAASADPPPAS